MHWKHRMANCDVCKRDYDKTFTITIQNNAMCLTVLKAPFISWRRFVGAANAGELANGVNTATLIYCSNHCAAAGILGSLPVAP